MKAIALYSLFVSFGLTVLWAVWSCTRLRSTTHFALNRRVILSMAVFSLIIAAVPFFVTVTAPTAPVTAQEVMAIGRQADAAAVVGNGVVPQEPSVDYFALLVQWLPAAYVAGLALSLLALSVSVGSVVITVLRARRVDGAPGCLRVVDGDSQPSFAWGGVVVMSRSDWQTNGSMILAHEQAHLRGCHWLELLAMNLVKCLTWYCPVGYLLLREMMAQQEYEADAAVTVKGFDEVTYQMFLIEKANGRRFANSVTNGINKPYYLLKNRITMMKRKKSDARTRRRVLPVIIFGAALFALPYIPSVNAAAHDSLAQKEEVVIGKKTVTAVAVIMGNGDEAPYEQLVLPSLNKEGARALSRKLVYPAEMQQSKTEGSVVVKINVLETGEIESAAIFESSGAKQLDEAVLGVVKGVKIAPATYEGNACSCECLLRVNFKSQSSDKPLNLQPKAPEWEIDTLLVTGA